MPSYGYNPVEEMFRPELSSVQPRVGKTLCEITEESTAYKSTYDGLVELTIPKDTLVYLTDTKCRAERVYVEHIEDWSTVVKKNSKISLSSARSWWDEAYYYYVGEHAEPDHFDKSKHTCSGGIHFYRSKIESVYHRNKIPDTHFKDVDGEYYEYSPESVEEASLTSLQNRLPINNW